MPLVDHGSAAPVSSRRPRWPRPRPPALEACGLSHPGAVRRGNQDAFLVAHDDLGLLVVADGMGGGAAGEIAANMAIARMQAVLSAPESPLPGGNTDPPTARLATLVGSVDHANTDVYMAAIADETLVGMGTALTAVLVTEGFFALAHVGHTRAYLLRGDHLERLTVDHTVAQTLMQAGVLQPDREAASEMSHVLTRALGNEFEIRVDQRLIPAHPGDTLLLASNGLHGVVADDEIAAVLLAERDLMRAASELINRANAAGAPDNVTVVLGRHAGE